MPTHPSSRSVPTGSCTSSRASSLKSVRIALAGSAVREPNPPLRRRLRANRVAVPCRDQRPPVLPPAARRAATSPPTTRSPARWSTSSTSSATARRARRSSSTRRTASTTSSTILGSRRHAPHRRARHPLPPRPRRRLDDGLRDRGHRASCSARPTSSAASTCSGRRPSGCMRSDRRVATPTSCSTTAATS